MGGDHKFLEEKMKLIVRPYSEPVLSSIYDKVGRKWTTFSYDEVGSLRKKLTSCSTKHIDDNEAFCSLLLVDGMLVFFKLWSFKWYKRSRERFPLVLSRAWEKERILSPHRDSECFLWTISLYFFTELKTYHLSYSYKKESLNFNWTIEIPFSLLIGQSPLSLIVWRSWVKIS